MQQKFAQNFFFVMLSKECDLSKCVTYFKYNLSRRNERISNINQLIYQDNSEIPSKVLKLLNVLYPYQRGNAVQLHSLSSILGSLHLTNIVSMLSRNISSIQSLQFTNAKPIVYQRKAYILSMQSLFANTTFTIRKMFY